jgi:cell division protein FtsQ
VAAVAVWGAGDHIAHGQTFRVNQVRFTGNVQSTPAQLRHLTDIRAGTHMLQADLNRAVHGVEKHPWVASASARRRFPGTVEITVREYTPELLVALESLWYADGAGHIFKQADPAHLDFPVLTGLDPDMMRAHPVLGREILASAIRILNDVRRDTTIDAGELSELHFDSHRGFSLVLRNGSRLVLGFGDAKSGLARIEQMVAVGLDLSDPAVIDLDIDSVAVVTPIYN